jgi:hypothetical protein
MQEPTEVAAEASVPTEQVMRDASPNRNRNPYRTFTVRRKAAKRTFPWDLAAGAELNLVHESPPPPQPQPQADDIPAAKKSRVEEEEEEPLLSASIEEAAAKISSLVTAGSLPDTHDDDNDHHHHAETDHADHVHTDPVKGAPSTGRWTPEEDANLKIAVTNTCKKKYGKEYKTDWVAIAALVPGRTRSQCSHRWHDVSDPSIERVSGRTGKWAEDEDIKLKAAVQTHGGKNWVEIAALVPGRTRSQCRSRWKEALDPGIDQVTGRTGKWKAAEDSKLKDAVQTHGGKNWAAIAALVPGRTRTQCWNRWHDYLVSNIDPTTARAGKWTADEDIKLKDAVHTHGGKNWAAISALVPGRTRRQCWNRWKDAAAYHVDTDPVKGTRATHH